MRLNDIIEKCARSKHVYHLLDVPHRLAQEGHTKGPFLHLNAIPLDFWRGDNHHKGLLWDRDLPRYLGTQQATTWSSDRLPSALLYQSAQLGECKGM